MNVKNVWTTHQGGTVIVTKTGLIHRAGNAYSGKAYVDSVVKDTQNQSKQG